MGRFHISATKFDALPRFKAWCKVREALPGIRTVNATSPCASLGGGACEALPFRAQARMLGRNAPERKTIMKVIATPNAPAAIGPYVQGRICGNLLFASGQIALSPETGELVGTTIEEQTAQVMKNVAAILAEAGTDFDHVLKATCFLDDIDDFAAFNAEYAKSFGDARPARSAVGVAKLPKGALVEVEVIAEV